MHAALFCIATLLRVNDVWGLGDRNSRKRRVPKSDDDWAHASRSDQEGDEVAHTRSISYINGEAAERIANLEEQQRELTARVACAERAAELARAEVAALAAAAREQAASSVDESSWAKDREESLDKMERAAQLIERMFPSQMSTPALTPRTPGRISPDNGSTSQPRGHLVTF